MALTYLRVSICLECQRLNQASLDLQTSTQRSQRVIVCQGIFFFLLNPDEILKVELGFMYLVIYEKSLFEPLNTLVDHIEVRTATKACSRSCITSLVEARREAGEEKEEEESQRPPLIPLPPGGREEGREGAGRGGG